MDILGQRPNVLFLIVVRKPDLYYKLLCIKKLRTNVYRQKVIKALSTYRISQIVSINRFYKSSVEEWFLNGHRHRDNNPAYIKKDCDRTSDPPNKITTIDKLWYQYDKICNDNGPSWVLNEYKNYIKQWNQIKDDGSERIYTIIYDTTMNEYVEDRRTTRILNINTDMWDE